MNPNYTKIWLLLAFTLVMLSFYGCTKPVHTATNDAHVVEKEWHDVDADREIKDREDSAGPTNVQGIADILGCVFAPHTCSK